MTVAARIGIGHILKRAAATSSPFSYTTIPEVVSIAGPTASFDMVDVTTMESTLATREFIAGLRDSGELTFEINFLTANAVHVGLRDDNLNRTKRQFQLVFPDSPAVTYTFAGFVSGFEMNIPIDDRRIINVTIKITGTLTIT
jgi:hypothetical protein